MDYAAVNHVKYLPLQQRSTIQYYVDMYVWCVHYVRVKSKPLSGFICDMYTLFGAVCFINIVIYIYKHFRLYTIYFSYEFKQSIQSSWLILWKYTTKICNLKCLYKVCEYKIYLYTACCANTQPIKFMKLYIHIF